MNLWLGSCRQSAFFPLGLGCWLLASSARAAEPPPPPVPRTEWTTSKLVGSPEPPLEFTIERIFPSATLPSPIQVVEEPGNAGRLLVVLASADANKPSRIVGLPGDLADGTPESYFELPGRLLYSLAFHPNQATHPHVYLFSNGPSGATERTNRVARYTLAGNPPAIAPASEQTIVEWRSMGHDGGDLVFGNDGMLYIATGDGTADSDNWNSGQSLDDLLGAILRIDVDHPDGEAPYSVPADNPFVGVPGARGEIWAYGLRNPWRLCVDRVSGQIWVGNNGQDLWETAHLARRGENYGWSVYEGSHPFYLGRQLGPTPPVPPTMEHHHAEFRSLTGGDVYRGEQFPELDGAYIYGDYSSGRVWGMRHDGVRPLWHRELADTTLALAAFRTTREGDLILVDHGGGALYRLIRTPKAPASDSRPPFPRTLGATGLFESVADHRPVLGVWSYSINVPGWHDGAGAERFLAVPGSAQIGFKSGASWDFPEGTALVQTLSRSTARGEPPRRIETRILLRFQGEWAGYGYRWNDEQTEAQLVPREGANATWADGSSWRFPSRAECMTCHSRAANFVLGLTDAQMNRDETYADGMRNQLRHLADRGLFSAPLPDPLEKLPRLPDPTDPAAGLEERARAYLAVNCAMCHVAAGGGNARMELGLATPMREMHLIGARPRHDTFGIENAMLVAPGEPERSVLLERLARRGTGQMPPLVLRVVDEAGVRLLRQWIAQLPRGRPVVRDWKLADLEPELIQLANEAPSERGRALFQEIGCAECHPIRGARGLAEGGAAVGPDLAGISRRFGPRELLEAILEPSKSVPDAYALSILALQDGRILTGKIEREDGQSLSLRQTALAEAPIEIPHAQIHERRRSSHSNMPAGTLNVLEPAEIVELLRFLSAPAEPRGAGP